MNKPCVLKDEYESAEWDNLTPAGEERAFPFRKEMKHLKIRIQSLNPLVGLCDAELNLLVWQIGFLQMPWFENQMYCLADNLTEATCLAEMPVSNFHCVYTCDRGHTRGLPPRSGSPFQNAILINLHGIGLSLLLCTGNFLTEPAPPIVS